MKHGILLFTLLAAATLLLAGAGCEVDRPDQVRIDIEPREATLRRGESITLRAFGWHSYHWSLSNDTLGFLSAKTGDVTVYTSIATNAAIQLITVSVTPGGTNVADVTTSAVVTHTGTD